MGCLRPESIPDISLEHPVLQPPPEQEHAQYGVGRGRGHLLLVPQAHGIGGHLSHFFCLSHFGGEGFEIVQAVLLSTWAIMGSSVRHPSTCSGHHRAT